MTSEDEKILMCVSSCVPPRRECSVSMRSPLLLLLTGAVAAALVAGAVLVWAMPGRGSDVDPPGEVVVGESPSAETVAPPDDDLVAPPPPVTDGGAAKEDVPHDAGSSTAPSSPPQEPGRVPPCDDDDHDDDEDDDCDDDDGEEDDDDD